MMFTELENFVGAMVTIALAGWYLTTVRFDLTRDLPPYAPEEDAPRFLPPSVARREIEVREESAVFGGATYHPPQICRICGGTTDGAPHTH